jgi:hypothetical protein
MNGLEGSLKKSIFGTGWEAWQGMMQRAPNDNRAVLPALCLTLDLHWT